MSDDRAFIAVFHTRKLEDANRAEAQLRAAGFPVERTRLVGKIEVAMPAIPEDGLAISWIVKAPLDRRKEAQELLAPLIQETGAQPPRGWLGVAYMLALLAFVIAITAQNC
jgi:hypothetical protein